jgi:hypothetical protein
MKEHLVPESSQRFLPKGAKNVLTSFVKTSEKFCDFFFLTIEKLVHKKKKRKTLRTSFARKLKMLSDKKREKEGILEHLLPEKWRKVRNSFHQPCSRFLEVCENRPDRPIDAILAGLLRQPASPHCFTRDLTRG